MAYLLLVLLSFLTYRFKNGKKTPRVPFISVFPFDPVPVAVEQRDFPVPEAKTAKTFVATEKRTQQRVTIVDETWHKKEVVKERQPQIEVEDDWFILLSPALKSSGIL